MLLLAGWGVLGCTSGLALGTQPALSYTGHCSQHLDGGEGVVCLTHKQVSWHEGQGGSSTIARLLLQVLSSFSSVVGGGHLLLGQKLREVTLLQARVALLGTSGGS